MKYAALSLLLALGACASLSQDAGMTDAACRQKALDAPEVQDRIAKMAGSYRTEWGEPSLEDLKHLAYVRCLRAKGLAPKGGVEPVKRNWY
ncbi:MAG: hypothetical protein BGP12_17750 [Rhodospirillales bacterium 70-18]|nr:hypothetical protein [Rhodospirillales bacterium]OJY65695.1 MAG: hypothetical protein BGP12_17750 [Rhodospirillales bacterium 70-18]